MLLPHMNRVAQAVFGDWDLSYIYSYQSGPPIAFGNVLLTGSAKDIPLSSSARTAAQWFNVNAFNRVTAQQLANNLITLSPTFAGIRAAAYNSSDSSLIKHVQIHESAAPGGPHRRAEHLQPDQLRRPQRHADQCRVRRGDHAEERSPTPPGDAAHPVLTQKPTESAILKVPAFVPDSNHRSVTN